MFGATGKESPVGIAARAVPDRTVGVSRNPQAPDRNMSLEYAILRRSRVIRELKDTQLGLQKTIAYWEGPKI